MNKTRINLPAGYFGMVLGIIGLGFSWRFAATIWPVTTLPADVLVILAILIWALLMFAFITRLIRHANTLREEIGHPLKSSFVSLRPPPVCWWRLA